MAIPSLAMIPSGYKATKLYSVLPTDGVGDFTVARASTATRVNQAGLIETVGADVPRLDYSDGGCPVLLTEPQATNLIPYSSDFSQWSPVRIGVTPSATLSLKGDSTASLIVPTAEDGTHAVADFTVADNGTYSIYIKPDGYNSIRINSGSTADGFADFNVATETIISSGGTYFEDAQIIEQSNGWYRCTLTLSTGSGSNSMWVLVLNELNELSYTADGTSGLYIWGGQMETTTYATSIIETTGNAITRVADVVDGAVNASTFNSTEGVLYAEIAALANDGTFRYINLGSSTEAGNRIYLGYRSTDNQIKAEVQVGGVSSFLASNEAIPSATEFIKVALRYKPNDFAFFINGVNVANIQSGITFPLGTLNELSFRQTASNDEPFYGKTKALQVFNSALDDTELGILTTI